MLSVIILNYNTFDLTCKCIESIVALTTIPYEIILVDNASSECSPKLFKEKFPLIKLICNNENEGFAKGNNTGIKHAKGDYILLLNSDTELLNNAIDLAFHRIQQDENIGALTAQLVSTEGSYQPCSYYRQSLFKLMGCTLKLHHLFPALKPVIPDLCKEHFSDSIYGTFFLFPRRILNIFPENKLTETFFMYVEDAEWCYYIKRAGYQLLYYPEARILHYGGASSKENGARHWKNRLNNEYMLLKKMHGKTYATLYFFTQSLFQCSILTKDSLQKAGYISKYTIKSLFRFS
jgi:GT2 family glycosyltransferase